MLLFTVVVYCCCSLMLLFTVVVALDDSNCSVQCQKPTHRGGDQAVGKSVTQYT